MIVCVFRFNYIGAFNSLGILYWLLAFGFVCYLTYGTDAVILLAKVDDAYTLCSTSLYRNLVNRCTDGDTGFVDNHQIVVVVYIHDGNKQTVEHLDTVQVNGSDYVICIPYKEEEDDEVDEVIILKMEYDENDDYILVPEEDLEVLDQAYELFKERNADLFDFED